MESYDVLVIILSVTLAILLVLSIVAVYYAVRVLKSLNRITEKAEHFAENMDAVGSFFKKTAGPVAISKLIANIIETVRSKDEGKGKKK